MEVSLYHYKAIVSSVYDGDTCTVDVDLGLGTWVKRDKLRLSRINAPEIRAAEREAGLLSSNFLRSRIDGCQEHGSCRDTGKGGHDDLRSKGEERH